MRNPLDGLSLIEIQSIATAAVLAHDDQHAEAEAARYAGNYHNLRSRPDADGPLDILLANG